MQELVRIQPQTYFKYSEKGIERKGSGSFHSDQHNDVV